MQQALRPQVKATVLAFSFYTGQRYHHNHIGTHAAARQINDAQIRDAAYLIWLDEGQPQGGTRSTGLWLSLTAPTDQGQTARKS
jgi:hypothetical protein